MIVIGWMYCILSCMSYHSDGEIVVDDFVGHRVTSVMAFLRNHLYAPAVHRNHRTPLDVFQDSAQIHAVVA